MNILIRSFLLLSLIITHTSCSKTTFIKYSSFKAQIDDKNELLISTYASFYPRITYSIPFIYQEQVTYDKLYFQVFIRQIGKMGKNPHVKSIKIHRFSYQINNQLQVTLLSDYENNFWMQGQDEKTKSMPIKYNEDNKITVTIVFNLNGKEHSLNGTMNPVSNSKITPLILKVLM